MDAVFCLIDFRGLSDQRERADTRPTPQRLAQHAQPAPTPGNGLPLFSRIFRRPAYFATE